MSAHTLQTFDEMTIKANLELDSSHGKVRIYDPAPNRLILEFSGGSVFRYALRTIGSGTPSRSNLDRVRRQVDRTQMELDIQVRDKSLLHFYPGRPPRIAYFRLLPQLLLLKLGR